MSYENAARQQLRHKWWLRAVGILACVVVFITVYALVLPAITLEGTPTCGLEEHTHTAECYDADGVLTCTLDEHVHDAACYAEEDAELAEPEPDAEEPAAEPDAEPADAEPADAAKETDDVEDEEPVLAAPVLRAPRLGAGGSDGSIMDNVTITGKNEWQIVSGEYIDNTPDSKTTGNSSVRVQKNVIPTDVENEFLVYLSVDTSESLQSYFEYVPFYARRSNNLHGQDGAIKNSEPNGQTTNITRDPSLNYPNSGIFTIRDEDGNVIAKDITLYWSDAQNIVIYCPIYQNDGTVKYLILTTSVKTGNNYYTIDLKPGTKQEMQKIDAAVVLNNVTDTLGDYIQYIETVDVTGSTSIDGKTLTWKIVENSNAKVQKETTVVDGVSTTITWHLNVAELLYRVKLNVDQTGFQSCANTINDKAGSPKYDTNSNAVLYYGDNGQVAFPQPKVRGLLYDVLGEKVAYGTNAPLDGATFQITPSDPIKTTTSSDGGKFAFVGLPWGEYTVTETAAPKGYQLDSKEAKVKLCYTDAPDSLVVSTEDGTHMMAKDQTAFTFVDKLIQPTIVLVKNDESTNPLDGAKFTITGPTGFEDLTATSHDGGQIATLSEAADGEYTVIETEAPAGYNLLDKSLVIQVDGTDVRAFIGENQLADPQIKTVVNEETGITTVTIVIHNNPGVVLPATGGMGTVIFTVSGLTLMAAAMILLSKQRKRNEA